MNRLKLWAGLITCLLLTCLLPQAHGQGYPVSKASQAEVNAGANDSKFVTPKTLAHTTLAFSNSISGGTNSGATLAQVTNVSAYQALLATNNILGTITNISAWQANRATNNLGPWMTNVAAWQALLATNNILGTITNISAWQALLATNNLAPWMTNVAAWQALLATNNLGPWMTNVAAWQAKLATNSLTVTARRSLVAGLNMTLTDNGSSITFDSAGGGATNGPGSMTWITNCPALNQPYTNNTGSNLTWVLSVIIPVSDNAYILVDKGCDGGPFHINEPVAGDPGWDVALRHDDVSVTFSGFYTMVGSCGPGDRIMFTDDNNSASADQAQQVFWHTGGIPDPLNVNQLNATNISGNGLLITNIPTTGLSTNTLIFLGTNNITGFLLRVGSYQGTNLFLPLVSTNGL